MDSRAQEPLHDDGRPGRSGGDEQHVTGSGVSMVGEGANPLPPRTVRATLAWAGGRSSKISIPCSRDLDGTWVCSRSACSASSGATFTSSGSAGAVTFSRRAAHGSAGPCAGVLNA